MNIFTVKLQYMFIPRNAIQIPSILVHIKKKNPAGCTISISIYIYTRRALPSGSVLIIIIIIIFEILHVGTFFIFFSKKK